MWPDFKMYSTKECIPMKSWIAGRSLMMPVFNILHLNIIPFQDCYDTYQCITVCLIKICFPGYAIQYKKVMVLNDG